ncbi:hypothetical protein Y032_0066g3711 [Ancylostoma ceylanicum]|uniref:Uncharacterized protein n=1 Tax=Ancylostoma ceylanicum TaxID=53326 RepID=A0A016TZY9_9BILA|nr:hypothetical protein Y032_0066g3711 [Ancylostoma ceylanicum]
MWLCGRAVGKKAVLSVESWRDAHVHHVATQRGKAVMHHVHHVIRNVLNYSLHFSCVVSSGCAIYCDK